jgi:hypothetical protein
MANPPRRDSPLVNMVISLPENKPVTCMPFGQKRQIPTLAVCCDATVNRAHGPSQANQSDRLHVPNVPHRRPAACGRSAIGAVRPR